MASTIQTTSAAAAVRPGRPRPLWRDLAIGLSLANLSFLRIWTELLTYTHADAYSMHLPPSRLEYLAAVVNVLLLGALFFLAATLARRSPDPRWRTLARWAFFVALLLPINALRSMMSRFFPYLKSPLFELVGTRGVALLALGACAAGLFVMWRWPRAVTGAAAAVLLVLSPLVPMTFAQALWKAARYDASGFLDPPPAPFLTGARKAPRVLWVIFDEWDQRLTFPARSPKIQLPEIDRFRAESLYAANAYSPGGETQYSMPALITGRMVADVDKVAPDELMLHLPDTPSPQPWSRQANIFSAARAAGFNTAVVGWYHPYCRLIEWSLSACWDWPMSRQNNSMGSSFVEILPNQPRSLFETELLSVFGRSLATAAHVETYRELLARAESVAANAAYGLVLLHLPVPHAPHAYNRLTGRFDLGNAPIRGYLDSLVLTDRTLAALRRAMQAAGDWDNTTILLSADHSYRAAAALDGHKDHRVPFLLKLAGHSEPATFSEPFNTLLTRDLLLAILRGEIATPPEAAAWIARHRTIADSPYNYN
jgi:hypothetical protein